MGFTRKKIEEEDGLSAILKQAREIKSLPIEEIAIKLNIRKNYLESLENGEFSNLPSGIYAKTFLKKYASFLGLNEERIMNIFETENKKENEHKNIFSKERVKKHEFLVFPKIIRIILIVLVVSSLFVYLGFYLNLSLSPPKIEITRPDDNLITNNNFIYVTGKTSSKTEININNKQILKDDTGVFNEKVDLKDGLNTIIITGKNKYSKKTIIEKQVLVK